MDASPDDRKIQTDGWAVCIEKMIRLIVDGCVASSCLCNQFCVLEWALVFLPNRAAELLWCCNSADLVP